MVSGEARLIRSAVNPLVSTIQLPPGAYLKEAILDTQQKPVLCGFITTKKRVDTSTDIALYAMWRNWSSQIGQV
jgi:hypothetical protein